MTMICLNCGHELEAHELSFGWCLDCLKKLSGAELKQVIAEWQRRLK